jgi:hypothetical protein
MFTPAWICAVIRKMIPETVRGLQLRDTFFDTIPGKKRPEWHQLANDAKGLN